MVVAVALAVIVTPPVVRFAQPSAGRSDFMVDETKSSVDYL
jgi:hypothetical protein